MNKMANLFTRSYVLLSIQTFSVILLLVLVEVCVRLFAAHITPIDINASTLITDKSQEPFFQEHPFAAFTWIPNARFARQTVSKDGFVSTRDIPFDKTPDEIRIVTLGGSSTVGNGNLDEDTYPRKLESFLQNRLPNKKITVINGAAGGYTTIESLGYLQTRLMYYKPDIILIMHAWNDMYYFARTPRRISEWRNNFNLAAMWNPVVALEMEDPMPADIQYLSWSQTYLNIRELVRHSAMFSKEGADVVLEKRYENVTRQADGQYVVNLNPVTIKAYTTYKRNLQQINNLCVIQGVHCYTIIQPTLIAAGANLKSPKIAKSVQTAVLYHGFDFNTHVEIFSRMYAINREVFGEDYTIDATSMSAREELFIDQIHQNKFGTEMMARIVLERLLKQESALLQGI